MECAYRISAYFWGWGTEVDILIDNAIDIWYDDLEWSIESRQWTWYVSTQPEADKIYQQLRKIKQLTIDILRYEVAASEMLH